MLSLGKYSSDRKLWKSETDISMEKGESHVLQWVVIAAGGRAVVSAAGAG